MNAYRPSTWTRREALRRLSVAAAAGLLGLGARPAAAEPPPETRTIRLIFDPEVPVLCYAPQYLVEDFLHLEGFTDVSYVGYGDAISDYQVLGRGEADISAGLGSDHIVGIDRGAPLPVLGGLHAGCVEVFGNDRVGSIRDIAGKRVAILGLGGAEHVFL
jgi:NitT/TauT family transport system substrate-binding protein